MTKSLFALRLFMVTLIVQSVSSGRADSSPQQPPIGTQLAKLGSLLSSQDSLTVIASAKEKVEPEFVTGGKADYTYSYKLTYKDNLFLYDVQVADDVAPTYNQIESYDGERYFMLNKSSNTLTTGTKPFVNDIVMREGHVAFMPFLFLFSQFKTNPFAQLSYAQLHSAANWKAADEVLKQGGTAKGVLLGDKQFIMARIGDGVDVNTKMKYSFDVYFDPALSGYPMRWEKRNDNGDLVASYSVDQVELAAVGGGAMFPYPKRATLRNFSGGKLQNTQVFEISDLRFNTVTNQEVFTIDPAIANKIRDVDAGLIIRIPK